jgi:hypothetical protein
MRIPRMPSKRQHDPPLFAASWPLAVRVAASYPSNTVPLPSSVAVTTHGRSCTAHAAPGVTKADAHLSSVCSWFDAK